MKFSIFHLQGGRLSWIRATCLPLFISYIPFPAVAGDLQVRIYERGGRAALQGVAVCLGTAANMTQFGSDLTDVEGNALFRDVPRAPLVLTVSKTGYKSERQSVLTSGTDRLLVLSLPAGGGGPHCSAGSGRAISGTTGIQVENLAINKGAGVTTEREVHLNHGVKGNPTQYRASEQQDFSDAAWIAYTPEPLYQLSPGNGRKVVYFQVRRSSGTSGADIQVLSPVVQDAITLQQP